MVLVAAKPPDITLKVVWRDEPVKFVCPPTDTVETAIKNFAKANFPQTEMEDVPNYQLRRLSDHLTPLEPKMELGRNGVMDGDVLLLTKAFHHQTRNDKIVAGVLILYTFAIFVFDFMALTSVWPKTSADMILNSTKQMNITIIPYHTYSIGPEVGLLSVMVLSGVLGACVYSLYAIALHLGSYEDFDFSWTAWYLTRPWIGAGLAFGVYVLIRGGVLTMGSIGSVSLLGLAGISVLVGLFTEQVMHKLNDLADTLFGPAPEDTSGAKQTNPKPQQPPPAK